LFANLCPERLASGPGMASFGEVKRLLPILRFLRNAFLTGLSLLAFIAFWAWLLTPEVLREEPEFDPEKIAG